MKKSRDGVLFYFTAKNKTLDGRFVTESISKYLTEIVLALQ